MASTFQLTIVSPDRTVVDEATSSVVAPGALGYFGVQANHEPFVSQLRTGILSFRDAGGQEQLVAISGGFLEASSGHVIVCADSAERPFEIDRDRVMAALDRAKKRLEERHADINVARAQGSMERALNRMKLLE
ncbi:MAG: ATP synthase epsilon chain [Fimbriimonadales bacterium]|nr:MAG: F0F1 ATP synthase subunit epsilon [Armatimonadota bacterium]MBV6503128.1 ATP synthase epsilon chain [Fimbriimonadales bacterium]MCE7900821.1 F0F1 ATP synthase subunit epsilon [Armatimonadetes bacterium ATM1]MDL1929849.1 F0F1 ATP synthase subunit epsilon [Fimbriimonadia bacterium ATM]MBC6970510.1 F0F1 ATP synthase subunit epsilon [Armatimonadota bacterium]